MTAALRRLVVVLAATLALCTGGPESASADPHIPIPDLPGSVPGIPGLGSDCKESPTPDMPGRGIAGFFSNPPDQLPAEADPFEPSSSTTIYEQYGYAGLRWRTYDLGCGPDAMRQPDAVIGTAMSNWLMQAPIALTALTGSLTEAAFHPTFLGAFDPIVERVSSSLHESLFSSWIPVVLALLGALIIFRSRRAALATTAAAIGWAMIVVILATAIFRWPLGAGHAVDSTVTESLGAVVSKLDGHGGDVDPGTAVASNVQEQLLYRAWLAGTLGSPDSETAKKYGPALFKSQALTWREAAVIQDDPEAGQKIIDRKQQEWEAIASRIQDEDPEAYENLTGSRSETRVGYAVLAALATFLSLPFLLLSSLLLLGCFLIVRLAIMLFPAFATLGAFPASRGLVLGLGRTVGSAIVNAIIFGVGAGVTVVVLGVMFHPGGGAPTWLSLVLMPLFSFMMWVALRPFRRLTTMVSSDYNAFGGFAGGLGRPPRAGRGWAGSLARAGIAGATGGAAAGAVTAAVDRESSAIRPPSETPERSEARPTPVDAGPRPAALSPAVSADRTDEAAQKPSGPSAGPRGRAPSDEPRQSNPAFAGGRHRAAAETPALEEGFVPTASGSDVPPEPTESEWIDGEDVYTIYRPDHDNAGDAA